MCKWTMVKAPLPLRILRSGFRALVDPRHRHRMIRFHLTKGRAFQPSDRTRPNRYPRIFRFVQERLGAGSDVRILSFGCSTGEEVFSLRHYFANARIHGIDIDAPSIATCRKQLAAHPDPRISFTVADSVANEPDGAYDAIFCMAVLRDGRLNARDTQRCDPLLDFADFAKIIADFARCLRPGGLLTVVSSNFRLSDTACAPLFRPVFRRNIDIQTPVFGPDNRRIEGETCFDAVFERIQL